MSFLVRSMGHHPIASLLLLCGALVYFWPRHSPPKVLEVAQRGPLLPQAFKSTKSVATLPPQEPTDPSAASNNELQSLIDKMSYMASCYQGHPCFAGEMLTPDKQRIKTTNEVLSLSKQIKKLVPTYSRAQLEGLESFLQNQINTGEEVLAFAAVDILASMPTDPSYLRYAFLALDNSTSELVCLKVMRVLKNYVEAGHVAMVFDDLKNFLENHRFETEDATRLRLNVLVHMHVLMKKDTRVWFEDVRSLYPEGSNEHRIITHHLALYE